MPRSRARLRTLQDVYKRQLLGRMGSGDVGALQRRGNLVELDVHLVGQVNQRGDKRDGDADEDVYKRQM